MESPNDGASASTPSHPPMSSHIPNSGLGLGTGLMDTFPRATVEDAEEEAKPATPKEPEDEVARVKLEESKRRVEAAEQARATITDMELASKGILCEMEALLNPDFQDPDQAPAPPTKYVVPAARKREVLLLKKEHDFFSNMANAPELLMELAKHLRPRDLLSLYCICKDFHEVINGHLAHSMRACADYMARDSACLFLFKFYDPLCVPDPSGRPHPLRPQQVRKVPGLKWLQMVVHREKTVRDILAAMARQGHRMPTGMAVSLKKMWLVMDISTTSGRVHMMHNRALFTDMDLYNIQLFICKLDMRFNDPIDGPGDESMRRLFLGQRGLTPLAHLLKRTQFLETIDVVKLGVRYNYTVRPEHRGFDVFGIPPEEIGIGHLEGWGSGRVHLMRPDELIMRESVRRRLGLKNYIMEMMLWGYIDPITGKDIEVTDDEKYISDDDMPQNQPLFSNYWDPDADDDYGDEDVDDDDDRYSDEDDIKGGDRAEDGTEEGKDEDENEEDGG